MNFDVPKKSLKSGLPAGWTRDVTKLILDAVDRIATP